MADKKAILLRIPQDLWDQLNRWARADLRSLNAQIEFLLRDAVRKRSGRPPENANAPKESGSEAP
ncbi:MAG TPA: Arc family DNA-binding protein [Phycisphaerae bacterium]|nr:Arc family DNA-binding protein [Phycisphaerae bacterium]